MVRPPEHPIHIITLGRFLMVKFNSCDSGPHMHGV